jgi:hypothetical protein
VIYTTFASASVNIDQMREMFVAAALSSIFGINQTLLKTI